MGNTTRPGTSVQDFWPDNTTTELYIESSNHTLGDILDLAKNHFCRDLGREDVTITSEYIHTTCVTYDQYDPSDYTNFIVVTLN